MDEEWQFDLSRRLSAFRMYRDRVEAGGQVADALRAYHGSTTLVLGIPRGGVPVAAEVARRLAAELDIVVARKIGAPFQPELALGAVTANGGCFLNEELLREIGITARDLEPATARERAEALRREARFRGSRLAPLMQGRVVILVDDGLATGATMRAAVQSVRKGDPSRLVVGVPVGSREACAALRQEVDELECLAEPEPFYAVGLYYEHFAPTEDAEVVALLQAAWTGAQAAVSGS